MSPLACDVLIIGGGIAGLSLASALAPFSSVVLVESEPTLGYHTSSRSARQLIPSYGPAPVLDLTRRTLDLLDGVQSSTGLPLTAQYRAGIEAGILVSAGPLGTVTPEGVRLADGREVRADAILWATGFRPALDHLAPLRLREPGGGIAMDGVHVVKDPRLLLVGYGASASTLGATRAGRAAATAASSACTSEYMIERGN